jgi:bifunctional UDP-N-acetylglucosamine pyrophosphorylase/glucosamine-1-phosphate N-acetyltransferase
MQVVILAAGGGTRMSPLTKTMSKAMIPIANKPCLHWIVSNCDFADEILIVISLRQQDVENYFSWNKKIKFVYQEEQLGTAHALAQCEEHIKGKFLLINGDELFPKKDVEAIAQREPYTIGAFPVEHTERFAAVLVKDGRVIDILEKQSHPDTNLARCGMDVLDERIFDAIRKIGKSPRGEYELPDAYQLLRNEGVPSYVYQVSNWISISYPWNILDANKYLLDLHGSQIGKAEIRPGVVIEDPVAIDDGAIIGPNCYIRAYSSIGKNCKVGQAVEIKNSIIMDDTYVSHLSYVGDSIIGRNVNVGAGTMFANLRLDDKPVKVEINDMRTDSGKRKLGAIVGDNVKFGVNVTVMPGKRIWPNLLIPPCITITEDIKEQLALRKRNGD